MKKRGKREGYSVWNHLVYLLRGIWSSDRVLMVLMVLEALSIVITPYVAMYLPKIGVDLVAARADSGEAACILGGLTIVVMISQAVGNMASRGKSVRQNRLRSHYRTLLFCKTLDCDYEHVESAEWQHKYNEAKVMSVDWGSWSGTTLMTEGAVKVCGAVVSFVLYGRIIGTLSLWVLLMIIVLSMINFAMLRRAQKYEVERIGERSVLQTSRSYMRDCSCDVRLGKDIRLYEMGDWIRSRFAHYNEAHFRLRREVQRRYFGAAFVEAASMFARDGISYLYFLWLAVQGSISIGDFILACSAIASFSALVTQTSDSVGQMMQAVPPLDRMRDYLDSADEDACPAEGAVSQVRHGEDEPVSIVFEDVSFSYKGRNPVLEHFDLRIRAGEKIALVGVNGAGKTTIIKLLCGLYQPDSGRILLNGVDVRDLRREDLYRLVAPVFQESVILPFTAAQNVSLQETQIDRERVRTSLMRVGLWDAVCKLPQGMDSMLMNLEEDGGAAFSGGQQQKLLMARALYKDAMLLLFDEPTAALDAIAESETYEMFYNLSGEKTAVFISHRLASTRFCDRVVFLENGKVKAQGSHEELLEKCPEYEEMYRVQSHYYKKEAMI